MAIPPQGRTALYRFFNADGALLYVGITEHLGIRWNTHAKKQPWWPQVARQTVDWHETRALAEKAETAAIKAEQPKYNIIHVPKPPKPKRKQNTDRHTPLRPLRIPDDEWEALGKAVGDRERTRLIREYIRWHLRWPGTTRPDRPEQQVGGPGISSKSRQEPPAAD